MKKYKYITIEQRNNEAFEEHSVYRIYNNKTGNQLGILSYYKPWKEYVFSSKGIRLLVFFKREQTVKPAFIMQMKKYGSSDDT